MDEAGTIRAGVSTVDPYANAYVSIQPAEWLNIAFRQTAEISSFGSEPKALYPGVDLKLRLMEEGKWWPEMSVGLVGATGHKRMSGEYLALSKRYNDFDFTGGLGWGRYGSSGTLNNPLNIFGGHFNGTRGLDGALPNKPDNWFTGSNVGFFGGVEYFTPLNGLSLKLDYGGDRWVAESNSFDYDAPAPWSAGFNYAPKPWINFGAALVGGKKIMATLSFQNNLGKWFGRNSRASDPPAMSTHRTDNASPGMMAGEAAHQGILLHDIRRDTSSVWAKLDTSSGDPAPRQIGRAARTMANHGGQDLEEFIITPEAMGLNGPNIRIMRRDLEQAVIHHQGSPQEIWRNASMKADIPASMKDKVVDVNRFTFGSHTRPLPQFKLILDTQLSLSEEDSGILARTGIIGEGQQRLSEHWMAGGGIRINGPDNLEKLNTLRPVALFPVRSDVAAFAGRRVTVDRLYNGYLRSFFNGSLHVAAAGGYLEEMYGGIGGEILYRPQGKTWAIGAEAWEAFHRDPYSPFAMLFNGDHVLSAHLKGWYEIPETDLTLGLKAGRYLGQDWGGTFTLTKSMQNGVKFDSFVTATNHADFDQFGGTTHLYSGVRLRLPLGNIPVVPRSSEIRMTAAPLGRDFGQILDSPLPLYEMTESFSARAMARDWNGITE